MGQNSAKILFHFSFQNRLNKWRSWKWSIFLFIRRVVGDITFGRLRQLKNMWSLLRTKVKHVTLTKFVKFFNTVNYTKSLSDPCTYSIDKTWYQFAQKKKKTRLSIKSLYNMDIIIRDFDFALMSDLKFKPN